MLTLYQQTDPIKDASGNIIGYESKPVVFPDTFPLLSGLKFDWPNNIVERNGKKYYMDRNTEITQDIPSIDKWKSIYGNTIENTYYAGLLSEHDDNPSGNINNIKRSVYKSTGVVKYILEFVYDSNDNVVRISSVAPADISAGEFDDIVDDIIDDSARLPVNNLKIIPFFAVGYNRESLKYEVMKSDRACFVSQTGRQKPSFFDGVLVPDDVSRIEVSFNPRNTSASWYAQVYGVDASGAKIYSDEQKGRYDIPNIARNIKFLCINITPTSVPLTSIKATTITQYNLGLEINMVTSRTIFFVNNQWNNPPQPYDCDNNSVVKLSDAIEQRMWFNVVDMSNGSLVAKPYKLKDRNTGDMYDYDAEVLIDRDMELEVFYAHPVTLTINNDNGTEIIQQKYFFDDDITLDVPVKQGYEFQYYTDDSGEIIVEPFRIERDTRITAQWYEL